MFTIYYFNYGRKQRPHSQLGPCCDAAVQTYIKRLCPDQSRSTRSHQGVSRELRTGSKHTAREEPGPLVHCWDWNKSQVLLVISSTFPLQMKQVASPTIFCLRRPYCIFSCWMRQVQQVLFHNDFICFPFSVRVCAPIWALFSSLFIIFKSFSLLSSTISFLYQSPRSLHHGRWSCRPQGVLLLIPHLLSLTRPLKSQLPWDRCSPTPLKPSEAYDSVCLSYPETHGWKSTVQIISVGIDCIINVWMLKDRYTKHLSCPFKQVVDTKEISLPCSP